MEKKLTDVAVLLIFFNRPEMFHKVFDAVRKARPSRLYLYQDGPRNDNDKDLVIACRKIVENIDWDCCVYRFYQTTNVGCDPSEYIAIKWMFEKEECGIILEDDDVPADTFFPFCCELLEKYKDDSRIGMICGTNYADSFSMKSENSYFFANTGAIWGWATWKRVVDSWDANLSFLADKTAERLLYENSIDKHNCKSFILNARKHATSGRVFYESVHGAEMRLNHRLSIVPKANLISNVGVGADGGTHSVTEERLLPKGIRTVFFHPTLDVRFPLVHPKYIMPDKAYEKRVNRILGYSFWVRAWRKASIEIRKLFYGKRK